MIGLLIVFLNHYSLLPCSGPALEDFGCLCGESSSPFSDALSASDILLIALVSVAFGVLLFPAFLGILVFLKVKIHSKRVPGNFPGKDVRLGEIPGTGISWEFYSRL